MARGGTVQRALLGAVGLALAALAGALPAAADAPRSQYTLEARLEPERHAIEGRAVIDWRNPSPTRSQERVVLRLVPNAFRGPESVYLRELGVQRPEALRRVLEDGRTGGIDLLSLSVDGAPRGAFEGLSTTVLELPLPRPLPPGGSVRIEADFRVDVPKVVSRFGRVEDLYVVVHWFPQVAGYRCCGEDEGFVAPEHHLHTELFKGFADYDVRLDVPEAFVVGSTGVPVGEPERRDGRAVHRIRAERVHDFAWVADPDFVELVSEAAGVEIRTLVHPAWRDEASRFAWPAARALEAFGEWFVPYPYPRLTLVAGHLLHHGMEYPNLVLLPEITLAMPRGYYRAEQVSVHEVGHQWWYGLAANDETSDAWLDEGINSFWTAVLMRDLYGEGRTRVDLLGLRGSLLGEDRARYAAAPHVDTPSTAGRFLLDRGSVVANYYAKPNLVFESLARRHGLDAVRRAFRRYTREALFRHPRPEEVYTALAAEIGPEAAAFARRWLTGKATTDPRVHDVLDVPADPTAEPDAEEAAAGERRQRVWVRQAGSAAEPVRVRVEFADGGSEEGAWDGARWKEWAFARPERIARVRVDPEGWLVLDTDPTNDVWRREPPPAAGAQARSLGALALFLLSGLGP